MPSGDFRAGYTFPDTESNGARKLFDTTGVVSSGNLLLSNLISRGYRSFASFIPGGPPTLALDGQLRDREIGAAWPGDQTNISVIAVFSSGEFAVYIGFAQYAAPGSNRMTDSEFSEASRLWCVFENANRSSKYRFGDAIPSDNVPNFRWNQGSIPLPAGDSAFRFALYSDEPFAPVVAAATEVTIPLPRMTVDLSVVEPGETGASLRIPFPRISANLLVDDPAAISFPSVAGIQSVSVSNARPHTRSQSATSHEMVYYDYGSNRYSVNLALRYDDEEQYRDFKARLDAAGPAATFSLPIGSLRGGFANIGSNDASISLTAAAPAGARRLVVDNLRASATDPASAQVVFPGNVIQSEDTGKTYAISRVDLSTNTIYLAWPIISELGVGARFRTGNNVGMVVRLARDGQPTLLSADVRGVYTGSLAVVEAL